METTLVIVKPDAVQRGLVGEIIRRLEAKGLKIIGLKMMRVSPELARRHYQEHEGKDFYTALVDYICSCPVVVIAVTGPDAVAVVRGLMGPTHGAKAPAGTIRGDLSVSMRYNLVHGSDSVESARRELELFFAPGEVLDYDRPLLKWCWQC